MITIYISSLNLFECSSALCPVPTIYRSSLSAIKVIPSKSKCSSLWEVTKACASSSIYYETSSTVIFHCFHLRWMRSWLRSSGILKLDAIPSLFASLLYWMNSRQIFEFFWYYLFFCLFNNLWICDKVVSYFIVNSFNLETELVSGSFDKKIIFSFWYQ